MLPFFVVLIAFAFGQDLDIEGPISIGMANKGSQLLSHYLKKHGIIFKDDYLNRLNLTGLEDIEERSNFRYKTKCDICDKNFRNSSYLMMHIYKKHLSTDQIRGLIHLNYFCQFVNCDINTLNKQENHTHSELIVRIIVINNQKSNRLRKCLIFTHQFLQFDRSNVLQMSELCEDIINELDNPSSFSLWEFIKEYFIFLSKLVFFGFAIYYEVKVFNYFSWLRQKRVKSFYQPSPSPSKQQFTYDIHEDEEEEDDEEDDEENDEPEIMNPSQLQSQTVEGIDITKRMT